MKKVGCVKFVIATLAIHSFTFLPHMQPKNLFVSPINNYWATFVAQMLKKNTPKLQQKNAYKINKFIFEAGRQVSGQDTGVRACVFSMIDVRKCLKKFNELIFDSNQILLL